MKLFAHDKDRGTSLVELAVTLSLIGVFGLSIYSMLNVGMIMGAKNGAVNTAHQQARVAMLQMVRDLHSAISLPALTDGNAVPLVNPAPNTSAAGISFQLFSPAVSYLSFHGPLIETLVLMKLTHHGPDYALEIDKYNCVRN